jgi:hypothetical protein
MKRWIKAGLAYGAMVFALGVALAALRALVLVPVTGTLVAHGLELALLTAGAVGIGLWVMARSPGGRWTTNSTFAFGLVGAGVALALDAPFMLLQPTTGFHDYLASAALTHAGLFPVALIGFALGPAMATQRA